MAPERHEFGGTWTEEKLDRVSSYLTAYMTALKGQSFQRVYIDAFAGTGGRAVKALGEAVRGFLPVAEIVEFAKGSARRALEVEPPFDRYVFIEANRARFNELKKLEEEYPSARGRMEFRNEDANTAIVDICQKTNWRNTRAVTFLDPYGMQIDWKTIEAVAATRAIDLWDLFPVGAVQRLLERRGMIPVSRAVALDRVLGDQAWRTAFYETIREPTLFGEDTKETKIAGVETIEAYVRDRLAQVFQGGVARSALRLRNSKGSCMYLLFFACANPKPQASKLALRIAQHILRDR